MGRNEGQKPSPQGRVERKDDENYRFKKLCIG